MGETASKPGDLQEQEAQQACVALGLIRRELQTVIRELRCCEAINGSLTDEMLVSQVFSEHLAIVALGRQELARRRVEELQHRFLQGCVEYAARFSECSKEAT